MENKMPATFFLANPNVWVTDGIPTSEDFKVSMADVVLEVKAESMGRIITLARAALDAGLVVLIWAERGTVEQHHRGVRECLVYGYLDPDEAFADLVGPVT